MNWTAPIFVKSYYPKLPYHNYEHVESFDWASCPSENAYYAAAFHDAHYDPMNTVKGSNEEIAFARAKEYIEHEWRTGDCTSVDLERVKSLILSTTDHVSSFDKTDEDMIWLHKNDLKCFRVEKGDFLKKFLIAENERKIFKEYSYVRIEEFIEKRKMVLNYYRKHPLVSESKIDSIIDYLSIWQPKVGIYCGSFNPFHRGHLDVLHQADKVFDKVIIAQGQNEEKETNEYSLYNVKALRYFEKTSYEGSLFSFLETMQKKYGSVSLIRGLRNSHDLHDESGLFNFGVDCTSVPFVYFISKSENVHVSSGAIRKLISLDKDVSQYIDYDC